MARLQYFQFLLNSLTLSPGMVQRSRVPGFYRQSLVERRALLQRGFGLDAADLEGFEPAGGLSPAVADKMVENAIGVLGLPLGVALNFVVDDEPVLVPMAVEEPSVIAACSYIARLAAEGGGFVTESDPPIMVAQVQLLDLPDLAVARPTGGGCVGLELRELPPLTDGPHADLDGDDDMLVVHLLIDCREAMGANAVNGVAEAVAPRLSELTGGRALLRILS
ncbi:MAG: hypothetical protein ACO3JL_12145, partial [Myxococcota bacterium]